MRHLFRAILSAKSHFAWLVMTFASMLFLVMSSQIEMLSLGIITNTGADFFMMFQKDERDQQKKVYLENIEERWQKISKGKNYITQDDASYYLGKYDDNTLARILYTFKKKIGLHGGNLKALIVLLVIVAVFKALGLFFSRFTSQVVSIKISQHLRSMYFEHIQKLPLNFYQNYNIGALSSRVATDTNQIARSLNACITNYIMAPLTVTSCLITCFYVSWQLTLVVFTGFPALIIPWVFISRKVRKITRQLQTNQEKFSSILIDFLSGIQTIKIFAMESFSFRKYKEQNDAMANLEIKTAKYELLVRPFLHLFSVFCIALVVLYGLHILGLSMSELLVFIGFTHLLFEPIKKFAEENSQIQKGIVAAERLFEVLDVIPQTEATDTPVDLLLFNDKIEFNHVWFGYGDSWILKDISFCVHKGETVAIVGPTGSGKSTILSLLPRLYDVQKGEIKIDGVDTRQYALKSLRKLMAFVSQKPFLFFDTISANISFGQKFPKDQVVNAAKQAFAHEFITKLPNQYDTHLSETGKNLSGGQQQRLAVARAMIKQAPILILDEATSSLDSISEDKIKQVTRKLKGQITQIIVAHRFSTIEHADRIIVIDNGEKVGDGTKNELLQNCPLFRSMWEAHYQGDSSNIQFDQTLEPNQLI